MGKGTRLFNPLEDNRFFHHWFSWVKNGRNKASYLPTTRAILNVHMA
jgi:hypothetical protein